MAEWPDADKLKRLLNVDPAEADNLSDILEGYVASAISKVKADRGGWDDDIDEPDTNLAAAALRMAELIAQHPEAATGFRGTGASTIDNDPAYLALIHGRRQASSFGMG
jgi:hypothetical protein